MLKREKDGRWCVDITVGERTYVEMLPKVVSQDAAQVRHALCERFMQFSAVADGEERPELHPDLVEALGVVGNVTTATLSTVGKVAENVVLVRDSWLAWKSDSENRFAWLPPEAPSWARQWHGDAVRSILVAQDGVWWCGLAEAQLLLVATSEKRDVAPAGDTQVFRAPDYRLFSSTLELRRKFGRGLRPEVTVWLNALFYAAAQAFGKHNPIEAKG